MNEFYQTEATDYERTKLLDAAKKLIRNNSN